MLLGMDHLSKFYLLISWEGRCITFSKEPIVLDGMSERIDLNMSSFVPILKVNINGQSVEAIYDTGAKRCFVNSRISEGLPVCGRVTDFFSGMSVFETVLVSVCVRLTHTSETHTQYLSVSAVCPDLVEHTLNAFHTQAIIGNDLTQQFLLYFAFPLKFMQTKDF